MLLICFLPLISLAVCYNETIQALNNSKQVPMKTVESEGGDVMTVVLPANPETLPTNNRNDLLSLEKEFVRNKTNNSKGRKGVYLDSSNVVNSSITHSTNETIVSLPHKTANNLKNLTIKAISSLQPPANKSVITTESSKTNISPTSATVMKPTVLVYEALAKSSSVSSSNKIILNKDLNPIYHPGMIIPLVITILIVPILAVFGCLAIRRGREAWKNRHYKRMDFLLDGMYNE